MAHAGARIYSIAGPTDESTISACAEAKVPVIRIMADVPEGRGYLEAELFWLRKFDALVPLLDRYGVALGVQNHCGRYVASTAGLRRLVEKHDRKHIAAVWNPAHEAVAGRLPEHALNLLWPSLCTVNLKNVYWRRTTAPDAEYADWQYHWSGAKHGLASWPKVATELRGRGYEGMSCLTAQYSDYGDVERFVATDLAFARSLFG